MPLTAPASSATPTTVGMHRAIIGFGPSRPLTKWRKPVSATFRIKPRRNTPWPTIPTANDCTSAATICRPSRFWSASTTRRATAFCSSLPHRAALLTACPKASTLSPGTIKAIIPSSSSNNFVLANMSGRFEGICCFFLAFFLRESAKSTTFAGRNFNQTQK